MRPAIVAWADEIIDRRRELVISGAMIAGISRAAAQGRLMPPFAPMAHTQPIPPRDPRRTFSAVINLKTDLIESVEGYIDESRAL